MDLFEATQRRRSVRAYEPRAVEADKLRRILTCALAAPSAGNLQAYAVVVVTDPDTRRALARAAVDQEFVAQAPVVLVFFQDPARSAVRYGRRGAELYSPPGRHHRVQLRPAGGHGPRAGSPAGWEPSTSRRSGAWWRHPGT